MPSSSDKKLLILYIFDVLKEFSDESHLLTKIDIAKKVERISNIPCDRKTVAANIKAFNSYLDTKKTDMHIEDLGRKGVYLSCKGLDHSELQYIIDLIYSNKGIPSKSAEKWTKKLLENESEDIGTQFRYVNYSDSIARVEKNYILSNIEIINDAIDNDKKIEFFYVEYNIHKKLVPKNGGKRYVVSPYFMLNSGGRYFLVCKYDGYDGITNYKIDRIQTLRILDESRYPLKSIKGYENGIDRAKYANENPLMCGGERIITRLLLHKKFIVNELVETFGKENLFFLNKKDGLYADVTASAEALVTWVFQYAECMEIVAPESQRNAIKALLAEVNKFYNNDAK